MGRTSGAPASVALSPSLPGGIPAPAGTATPPLMSNPRIKNARKKTLLSLLDALSELTKDTDLAHDTTQQPNQPSFEDDRDVPTVDEQHQVQGAEVFNRFSKRITNLDKELRNFSNAARQLGSSVAILSSAFHLRERLAQILFLFRENAADLFPRKVTHHPLQPPSPYASKSKKKAARARKAPPHVAMPKVQRDVEAESFPAQIEMLAKNVKTFLDCLNEFPEFTDEGVTLSILSFEGDLMYWASCLKVYEGQFKFPAVQRYLHELTEEMGEQLDSITTTLAYFTEVGVPSIRVAQKHGAANLQNLSTIATFFSAVTATTLQFSFPLVGSPIKDAVNAFWFSSLVFSIASAVNSLLGVTWKQAIYRSPGHRVPWWVLIWIKRSPLVFLVVSVACFSIGLVLFAYASNQSPVTSTITTVFTAFSSFGLAAVSIWFASERWAFSRHKGKRWLDDILDDVSDRWMRATGLRWIEVRAPVMREEASMKLRKAGTGLSRAGTWTASTIIKLGRTATVSVSTRRGDSPSVEDANGPPSSIAREPSAHSPRMSEAHTTAFSEPRSPTATNTAKTSVEGAPSEKDASGKEKEKEKDSPEATAASQAAADGRERLRTAVRHLIMFKRALPDSPLRKRTISSDIFGTTPAASPITGESPGLTMRSSRVAALTPKLACLATTQDLAAHSALVRHLQFSPDGKFLATCSWDKTCVMWRVGSPMVTHRVLLHPSGFVGQVAWSPSGNSLLTRLTRSVKIWTQDGVCRKTIERKRPVQSITWLPGGEAFMSVEKAEHGSDVVKLDLTGKILKVYQFLHLDLHDVAVTPDCSRMLGVGTLLQSTDGLKPSRSRMEKRIIVYNLDNGDCESQVPVLNDVRDITLANNGHVALVSYENKAPPQLWNLDHVKDKYDEHHYTIRLTLRHTYMPKVPVDFAGPSYFGGQDDQLVLCAAKAGDIHIWDRESGAVLHHVRTAALGGDLTCIAWNPAADDPFMFATGSHDGTLRIWTRPPPQLVLHDLAADTASQGHGSGYGTPRSAASRSRAGSMAESQYPTDGRQAGVNMVDSPMAAEFSFADSGSGGGVRSAGQAMSNAEAGEQITRSPTTAPAAARRSPSPPPPSSPTSGGGGLRPQSLVLGDDPRRRRRLSVGLD